jgi:hypothetical protein
MTSMTAPLHEDYTFDVPLCKRKVAYSDTEGGDEMVRDIFSVEYKKILATKVSRCHCGGLRICMSCVLEHNPSLLDCDDVSDYTSDEDSVDHTGWFDYVGCLEKLPDLGAPKRGLKLCKRSDDTCDDSWYGIAALPCTICQRYGDNNSDVFSYAYQDCHETLLCDDEICPHGLVSEQGNKCTVCDTDCTV